MGVEREGSGLGSTHQCFNSHSPSSDTHLISVTNVVTSS